MLVKYGANSIPKHNKSENLNELGKNSGNMYVFR